MFISLYIYIIICIVYVNINNIKSCSFIEDNICNILSTKQSDNNLICDPLYPNCNILCSKPSKYIQCPFNGNNCIIHCNVNSCQDTTILTGNCNNIHININSDSTKMLIHSPINGKLTISITNPTVIFHQNTIYYTKTDENISIDCPNPSQCEYNHILQYIPSISTNRHLLNNNETEWDENVRTTDIDAISTQKVNVIAFSEEMMIICFIVIAVFICCACLAIIVSFALCFRIKKESKNMHVQRGISVASNSDIQQYHQPMSSVSIPQPSISPKSSCKSTSIQRNNSKEKRRKRHERKKRKKRIDKDTEIDDTHSVSTKSTKSMKSMNSTKSTKSMKSNGSKSNSLAPPKTELVVKKENDENDEKEDITNIDNQHQESESNIDSDLEELYRNNNKMITLRGDNNDNTTITQTIYSNGSEIEIFTPYIPAIDGNGSDETRNSGSGSDYTIELESIDDEQEVDVLDATLSIIVSKKKRIDTNHLSVDYKRNNDGVVIMRLDDDDDDDMSVCDGDISDLMTEYLNSPISDHSNHKGSIYNLASNRSYVGYHGGTSPVILQNHISSSFHHQYNI